MGSTMCLCRTATTKAYDELRRLGESEGDAYDAAVRIYRHHHPEHARIEAYQTVADWLEQHEAGLTKEDSAA